MDWSQFWKFILSTLWQSHIQYNVSWSYPPATFPSHSQQITPQLVLLLSLDPIHFYRMLSQSSGDHVHIYVYGGVRQSTIILKHPLSPAYRLGDQGELVEVETAKFSRGQHEWKADCHQVWSYQVQVLNGHNVIIYLQKRPTGRQLACVVECDRL